MNFKHLGKAISLSILTLGLSLVMIQPSFAEGIVTDKDTIENRGPGNLDTPTEKTPAKAKANKAAEKKAKSSADTKAPEKKPAH